MWEMTKSGDIYCPGHMTYGHNLVKFRPENDLANFRHYKYVEKSYILYIKYVT